MPRSSRTNGSQAGANIWPGFVDALATLLLVIIFLLVVFVLAQVLLSQAISGKDEALDRLNRQVTELAELLNLERQANADLRLNIAQLSASLQESVAARDAMDERLSAMTARAEQAESSLARAEDKIAGQEQAIEQRLLEIESLRRDIASLRKVRDDLEARVAELAGNLKQREAEIGTLRDRSKELEARLAESEERTALAQKQIAEREVRISELLDLYARLEKDYKAEQSLTTDQKSRISLLNQQLLALRKEIERLNAALDAAESKDEESRAVIADLGRRLNRALASKVEELSRYRSEFFGRLREVLGKRKGIQIVGDRFVFQSEVLFNSGEAYLGPEGQEQMKQLASTLIEIAREIPPELNWILRVDGHTDHLPINTPQFPSNWELSSARAISVVKFLVAQGVPAERLAATGFAQYQPLDSRDDEIGLRRNRRIELKLTQR
jgi:chemotaxis protein MotB